MESKLNCRDFFCWTELTSPYYAWLTRRKREEKKDQRSSSSFRCWETECVFYKRIKKKNVLNCQFCFCLFSSSRLFVWVVLLKIKIGRIIHSLLSNVGLESNCFYNRIGLNSHTIRILLLENERTNVFLLQIQHGSALMLPSSQFLPLHSSLALALLQQASARERASESLAN